MSESVPRIDKIIKEAEKEIDAIKKRRIRQLKENKAEMKSAKSRRDKSIELKEYLLA